MIHSCFYHQLTPHNLWTWSSCQQSYLATFPLFLLKTVWPFLEVLHCIHKVKVENESACPPPKKKRGRGAGKGLLRLYILRLCENVAFMSYSWLYCTNVQRSAPLAPLTVAQLNRWAPSLIMQLNCC